MVLATNSSNATPEEKLILGDWMDNNSYCDEWIVPVPNTTIQLEGQETAMWCWIASARMMASRYQISPISQASAAVYIKLNKKTLNPSAEDIEKTWRRPNGDTFGGTVVESEEALEYLTGLPCYSASYKIYSESTLRSILDSGYPVRISRGTYDIASEERLSGHATVIESYYWDASSNNYIYVIYDPWPVNQGRYLYYTYDRICRENISASEQTIWESIVVYQKGNYTITIDWPGV